MSLVLNALPDPDPWKARDEAILQIKSLQRALQEKNERIAELELELNEEKTRSYAIEISAANLRTILTPLYNAIGGVFGHIEAMNITTDGRSASKPASSEESKVWESWKQKLGGKTAEAISVLLMHGPMTQAQLRIQLSCATRTVTNVVGALNRAALINKANGKISLKELYK
jgi:hypothetical protein